MIVKPDTLRDQAYKLIRNQIVTRELPLGSISVLPICPETWE